MKTMPYISVSIEAIPRTANAVIDAQINSKRMGSNSASDRTTTDGNRSGYCRDSTIRTNTGL